jgi:hypothetical protein
MGNRRFAAASQASLVLNMKTAVALSLLLVSSASAFAPASMMTVRRVVET